MYDNRVYTIFFVKKISEKFFTHFSHLWNVYDPFLTKKWKVCEKLFIKLFKSGTIFLCQIYLWFKQNDMYFSHSNVIVYQSNFTVYTEIIANYITRISSNGLLEKNGTVLTEIISSISSF